MTYKRILLTVLPTLLVCGLGSADVALAETGDLTVAIAVPRRGPMQKGKPGRGT
ncbi:MAG: hypothetical protein QGG36_19170 [Pirellulaceae bacterium]|jgi:hypothetical protein|nr:hypothetical protein [Pirellulaceae bacterium]